MAVVAMQVVLDQKQILLSSFSLKNLIFRLRIFDYVLIKLWIQIYWTSVFSITT